MEATLSDVFDADVFQIDEPPEPELTSTEYDCDTGNELPSRALVECAVFAEDNERGGCLVMHDLQSLDSETPPPLDVVGRVTLLAEDGNPDPDSVPGACARTTTDVSAHCSARCSAGGPPAVEMHARSCSAREPQVRSSGSPTSPNGRWSMTSSR